ncbi:MAG: DNA-directed RNA polymerase subunit alpha [bacterium]
MQKIALPKNITFIQGDKPNQKFVIIEPLYPGYGTTLGNSLRRVLLSSLPGTAVVGVKIKGAEHEFMALPNIKEDVLDIALNLKQLTLKIHTDEIVRLELEARGEKEVKASDIKANSDVEIINKDLLLAHITDPAGTLEMEIFVSRGMGYETIENREDRNKEIGYIEIDSIFSPVLAAGIDVENTRVGKMTNWDKLSLDITTDGIINPEQAFEQAVNVLIDQFNALLKKEEPEEEEIKEELDLSKLTRAKLNELAKEKGIEEPEKMKTKDDVINAINNYAT